MLNRIRIFQWVVLLALLPAAQAQNPIQLPDVVGTAGVRTRSIQVVGEPASLASQAARLFDLHGGFSRATGRPDFTLRFDAAGATAVNLTISSGGRTQWQGGFNGATQREALCAAADAAVQKTLGIPGFFQTTLVFVSDRTGHSEIYLSDMLFSGVRQLTRDGKQCLSPNLAPDGRTILYTSYHATGFPDIFRIELPGGLRTKFAGYKGTNTGANFSPDGRRVAMIMSSSGNSEVYVTNSEGRQIERVTNTKHLEADPDWSPDGRRLAVTSDRDGGPQIFIVDMQSKSMTRLPTNISRNCSEPTWNPVDPDKIVFTAATAGEFELAIYSFSARKSTFLSKGPGDAVHPAWLRDGRHLVYTERTSKYNRLMVLDIVTGKAARLSPDGLNNAREASPAYLAR